MVSRIYKSTAGALICLAAAGCATPKPVVTVLEERHARMTLVQSIPRGAWIEVDGGYRGTAPATVETETSSSGRPRRVVTIRATDVASGAWEEKRFYGAPMPEKVLFDLRSLIRPADGLTF